MGKKNHTDCSVSVLLDPADTEVVSMTIAIAASASNMSALRCPAQ